MHPIQGFGLFLGWVEFGGESKYRILRGAVPALTDFYIGRFNTD
jgi:hypothetical protein